MSTHVTIKGQVTIPKRIRDALGIVPGDAVDRAGVAAEPAVERLSRGPHDRERGGQVVGLQVDH